MRRTPLIVIALVLTSTLTACRDGGSGDGSAPEASAPSITGPSATVPGVPSVEGTVTVFAAASLTTAFTEIGEAFTALHPEAEVAFNFGASSELVTQIGEGAPADVFASADPSTMAKLTDAGNHAGEPALFARNSLEIVVASGNPLGITDVRDLADEDLVVVTCAPQVPCGRYAREIFDAAGVTVTPKSLEENVKGVVTKVALGEADAGIVYRTDVIAAGDAVTGVAIPADVDVLAEYPIAVTTEGRNPDGARAFVDVVLGEQGQRILRSYGFLAP